MAAHLPKSNCVQFAMRQTLGDDTHVTNVYHCIASAAGPYSGLDLHAAASTFYDLWTTQFMAVLSDELSATACIAKDLSVVDGAEATFVPLAPVIGASHSPSLPASTALVTSWKEAISYKGGHPRSYFAGIPNTQTSDPQHVTSDLRTTLQAAANAFISAVAAAAWPALMEGLILGTVHYLRNKIVLAPPEFQPFLSALVDSRIDSQRRRLQS